MRSTSNKKPISPSVSHVTQSIATSAGSINLKSETGSFILRAAPYKLFSSMYMIDNLSRLDNKPSHTYLFSAVTICLLQNVKPPRMLLSKRRYISGNGHRLIGRSIFLSAADNENCDIVM